MSRPPRIPGFDYRGPHRYSLTTCCLNRARAFDDGDAASETETQFLRTASDEGFELIAYCLMPDHGHLIVEGLTSEADLRRFMKLAKQRSGAKYARRHNRPLWQEGYYDRVLRKDQDLVAQVRYILNNPVRAGLVQDPADYPHSGSSRWTLRELFDYVG